MVLKKVAWIHKKVLECLVPLDASGCHFFYTCGLMGGAEREGEGKTGGHRSRLSTTHLVFRNRFSHHPELIKEVRLSCQRVPVLDYGGSAL